MILINTLLLNQVREIELKLGSIHVFFSGKSKRDLFFLNIYSNLYREEIREGDSVRQLLHWLKTC